MRNFIALAVAAGMSFSAVAGLAVTNVWVGANTTGKTASDNDVDLGDNWSLGHVPTAGECALIKFASKQAHLYIGENSAFAPDELVMDFNNTENNVYLDKSLTLTSFKLNAGSETVWSGNKFRKRFFIGRKSSQSVLLKITGEGEAFDLRGASSTWATVGWSTNTVVELSGKEISFSKRNYNSGTIDMKCTDGGVGFECANAPIGITLSSIRFADPDAVITMGHQNARRDGTLGPGYGEVHVYSTQTWNADELSFVDFLDTFANAKSVSVPVYFKSLDGNRLDNLSNVNIVNWHISGNATTDSAMTRQLEPGTYGSVFNYGGTTSKRNSIVAIAGDVRLCGYAVYPGSGNASARKSDYSYIQYNINGSSYHYLALNGHELKLDHGAYFRCNDAQGALWIQGGTLISNGDICFDSTTHSATNASPNSQYGIVGKNGRIMLAGDFRSNLRSTSAGSLSTDTVEMIGGGNGQTWEVCDKSTASGLATKSSFSIGTFKVGVGTTNACVKLVNEFLNDNPTNRAEGVDVAEARAGEKMIVGNLSIADNSTLDVNAQQLQIVSSLSIAPTGTLKIDTGSRVTEATTITNVVGVGDQTSAWSSIASRVKNTSSPGVAFRAEYDAVAKVTHFVCVPQGLIMFLR